MDGVIIALKINQASKSVTIQWIPSHIGYQEIRGPTSLQMMHIGCPHLPPMQEIPDARRWMYAPYFSLLFYCVCTCALSVFSYFSFLRSCSLSLSFFGIVTLGLLLTYKLSCARPPLM